MRRRRRSDGRRSLPARDSPQQHRLRGFRFSRLQRSAAAELNWRIHSGYRRGAWVHKLDLMQRSRIRGRVREEVSSPHLRRASAGCGRGIDSVAVIRERSSSARCRRCWLEWRTYRTRVMRHEQEHDPRAVEVQLDLFAPRIAGSEPPGRATTLSGRCARGARGASSVRRGTARPRACTSKRSRRGPRRSSRRHHVLTTVALAGATARRSVARRASIRPPGSLSRVDIPTGLHWLSRAGLRPRGSVVGDAAEPTS
jgi:hypothetical protein